MLKPFPLRGLRAGRCESLSKPMVMLFMALRRQHSSSGIVTKTVREALVLHQVTPLSKPTNCIRPVHAEPGMIRQWPTSFSPISTSSSFAVAGNHFCNMLSTCSILRWSFHLAVSIDSDGILKSSCQSD